MRKMVVASKEALGDAATAACGNLWRDVKDGDSGEVVVSSIRTGMKREFAMMMKAQSEMGGLSVGRRRVTRSQSASSFSLGRTRSGAKTGEKVMGSSSKRMKKGQGKKLSRDGVGKLEIVEDDVGARKGDVVGAGTDMEGDLGIVKAVALAVERSEGERVESKLIESVSVERNEGEKPECEDVVGAGTDMGDDLEIVEAVTLAAERSEGERAESIFIENVTVERNEGEKAECKLTENVPQSLPIESPLPQVGGNDVEFGGENRTEGASNVGCEMVVDATSGLSEKPLRRFTRSVLKLQDETTRCGSGATMVESGDAATSNSSPSKLEMKMSKKVELKKVPTKLKDLLETGLLEGLRVRYARASKGRGRPELELHGIIRGPGILCSCCECKGEKVVTPNQFEMHAHSGNKRPPEYIFLENGKSLRDVLNACKVESSDSVEVVIQRAIGRSNPGMDAFCLSCNGPIPEASANRGVPLCDSCVEPKKSDSRPIQISDTTSHGSPLVDSHVPVASSTQIEVSENAGVSSNSQLRVKRQGKLTRKDLGMHKSVFTENVLPDGAVLHYVLQGEKKLEGFKKDGGIFCTCCDSLVSPSQFEAHAGFSSRRKPYDNIYMSNGVSLHELALKLSENRKSSTEENDDLCSICEDGGDLLCCEQCPRAFHPECVGLERIPQGAWLCRYCHNMRQKEKFAERNRNAIAAGRVAGVDPLSDLRCVRVVATFGHDIGGCAICRDHSFSSSEFDEHTVIICDQCEKEYHVGCLREQTIADLQELPQGDWFCCSRCSDINSVLQRYTSDGEMMLPEALLSIINKKRLGQGLEQDAEIEVRWRLLRGKTSSESTRKWLSGAVSIFHDQFAPIADASTDSLDLIPDMVYGRPFKDHDFAGMYCGMLIVDSVIMCAALFRIFGEEVAELPLVATKKECEGKGYFQALFFCIENLLVSLRVKDLVLPAASNAESLWKNRFGFQKLVQEQVKEYKKKYQMLIFEGTSVLHKTIS